MPTEPLTRDGWIALAVKVLRTEGPSALTVDRLTRREGRGEEEFRNHFKGIGALILALVEHWAERGGAAAAAIARAEGPAADRLLMLFQLTGRTDAALEQGVRALAADYVEVADAVRAADDRRELIFTTVLAGVYDLKGTEAHQFGRLFHALHLAALTRAPGEAAAFADGPGRALIAMLASNFPVD